MTTKISHVSAFAVMAGLSTFTVYGDFESFDLDPTGNLNLLKWSETNIASPSTQRNLFKIGGSNGVNGSKGLYINTSEAESSYRATHTAGASGAVYQVSSRFKITIGNSAPVTANHAICSVYLSSSPLWSSGNGIVLNLVRRDGGKRYGLSGIGKSSTEFQAWQVSGWEANSELGLPNSLPGSTASSQWFTLSLTVTSNSSVDALGRPLWDVLGEVKDESGTVVFSLDIPSRPITSNQNDPTNAAATAAFQAGDIVYAGIGVPYVESATSKVLSKGKVTAVNVDDFSFTGGTPPPVLPPHQITMSPSSQDLDENGLPDVWEALYKAKDLNPNADSDGDGVNNAREAAAGTDPFDPFSVFASEIAERQGTAAKLKWTYLNARKGVVETSTDLGATDVWDDMNTTATRNGGMWETPIALSDPRRFYRVRITEDDADLDGVPDWLEPYFGFSSASGQSNSAGKARSYDTTGNGTADTSVSGDLAAFNEIYRRSGPGKQLTNAQAARLLLQCTFGPADKAEVERVASIGAEAWVDEQLAKPPVFTKPYVLAIKNDWKNNENNPSLAGYAASSDLIHGLNFMNSWPRNAVRAPDQLRQRVAWSLSQILVASRAGAMLANQLETTADYYDKMINHAFGSYEDLLLEVSLSPYMGHYLSHLGNRKENAAANRFPDENYAREVMQLFSIGLWELNPDGTQKLDGDGEPIPTYDNGDITQLARVFTGTHYNASNFGGGYRDDGPYMNTPMKVFASEHDFNAKTVVSGNGTKYTIPARSANDANALKDVKDAIHQLVIHPNTAPFISRQLIQFLITSNPSPEYVARISAVFTNNGNGEVGDLKAVVRAIVLDEEARDPMRHLSTPHFGQLREPTVRTMHLARMLKMGRISNLLWWSWDSSTSYKETTLQEPMNAPSVFNYFRPDYRLFGELAQRELDSPAFGITDSYSSISFPNYLWNMCTKGIQVPNINSNQQREDLSELEALAPDIPALLDHLSLLYCAGTLGAQSRAIISTSLASENNMTDRARLAAYLVLVSPEGACLK
ncbi:DUF1800 family protein [Luteolibacter algae]|uniref:DUF1800 family protein n=1 Tax=Luteolibacter algae TaxID=454151 RepID=A0ABW5D8I3_9BACT